MAIKAKAQITLSAVVDVQAVWRYYKLQSSTLAKPAKPTANPPAGWSSTEPSYTEGSTNSLYTVDLNVFSDGTWSYSEVSKSSSYEAAKLAYNVADAANKALVEWCAENDKTMIDGGKVYMDKAFVNRIFAQDIIATGSIQGARLHGAKEVGVGNYRFLELNNGTLVLRYGN